MHYQTLLTISLLPLAILAATLPTYTDYSHLHPRTIETQSGNITFLPPVHSSNKRAAQPGHCVWPVGRARSYFYVDVILASGTACFGWVDEPTCNGWVGKHFEDIQASIKDRVP